MNQIRLATSADAEAIRAIYAPYVVQTTFTFEYEVPTREEFLRRMESFADYPWLVYEQEGRVVGYAYASPFNERAAYAWTADISLYLDMDCRGAGIGRKLCDCMIALLQLQGVRNLYGIVTDPNPVSFRFHQKLGFEQKGHFDHIGFKHGKWLGVDFMAKDIAPVVPQPDPVVPFPQLDKKAVEAILADYREE